VGNGGADLLVGGAGDDRLVGNSLDRLVQGNDPAEFPSGSPAPGIDLPPQFPVDPTLPPLFPVDPTLPPLRPIDPTVPPVTPVDPTTPPVTPPPTPSPGQLTRMLIGTTRFDDPAAMRSALGFSNGRSIVFPGRTTVTSPTLD
jgi:hypothetical protein